MPGDESATISGFFHPRIGLRMKVGVVDPNANLYCKFRMGNRVLVHGVFDSTSLAYNKVRTGHRMKATVIASSPVWGNVRMGLRARFNVQEASIPIPAPPAVPPPFYRSVGQVLCGGSEEGEILCGGSEAGEIVLPGSES